jgi:hypothetical protein
VKRVKRLLQIMSKKKEITATPVRHPIDQETFSPLEPVDPVDPVERPKTLQGLLKVRQEAGEKDRVARLKTRRYGS